MKNRVNAFQLSLFTLLGILPHALSADGPGRLAVPEVDVRAMEVSVTRHQGTLWRYTRFSTESDYPCLRFEAIEPGQDWRVVDRQDVCEVSLEDGQPLIFKDTAYTGFTDISFSQTEGAFLFRVEYLRRTAHGEKDVSCLLPVTDSRLGTARCR